MRHSWLDVTRLYLNSGQFEASEQLKVIPTSHHFSGVEQPAAALTARTDYEQRIFSEGMKVALKLLRRSHSVEVGKRVDIAGRRSRDERV